MSRITPREKLPVSRTYDYMVPFRTLFTLNKYLSTIWAAKAVPSLFILGIHVLVPGTCRSIGVVPLNVIEEGEG